ncbi:branched-chain amino acid aminotransferase [Crocinitomicaceae bacterium CZZ-1]|uniref:branched-chain-amino-acid transaminase n=1 Tax=Taishania pollutisoli TaxID=2766479 RepID=A0A8J6TT95_9FLAO|nr:branched-chain amino acid aminotransferase [Taishania pollutisoli]MBC9812817.1 branched-chain amino acid aminotransferase [Taishania pollutisoli]MBX2949732.1 branched-chain amino acid aminotransferase [Crocinitomicaceae bacterium]NGF76152.1 branched-chain amino acid aminotransferase [Fluviicola sp. SGL-29]
MKQDLIEINISHPTTSKISQVDWDNLPFGKVFTDHMLVMDYKNGKWQSPEIVPFGPIPMHPAMSAIHYGQSIFEGMKAYSRENGDVVLFRPEMNAKRFMESCERLCMPAFDEELFVELVRKLVEVDKNWVPKKEGAALYIRPFIFGTDEAIGIKPSDTYKFVIFLCPVGAYYSQPVNVKIEEYYTRAAAGGVGRAKTAGNYAAALYPAKKGQENGYHQLLWTDAKEHKFIEESGTMNICFMINGTLVTPSEDEDTILRGTTKRTLVDVADKWGIPVEERKVSVEEIVKAIEDGTLNEAFGAGTAATIATIVKIGYRDGDFILSEPTEDDFSMKAKKYLDDLKAGKTEDPDGWCLVV